MARGQKSKSSEVAVVRFFLAILFHALKGSETLLSLLKKHIWSSPISTQSLRREFQECGKKRSNS
jgi:hypothetical protein